MSKPKGGGYGRPPVETRFTKGLSGNPKGRPKGSKNLSTLLLQALNEKVTISQNGRSKRVTKSEVIAKQLVNKAASLDWAAVRLLLGALQTFGDTSAGTDVTTASFTESDRAILERLRARLTTLKPE